MTFAVPMRVRTGPSALLSMVHCTFAGAPVCTVHHSSTLAPGRTSTSTGAVTMGGSKIRKETVMHWSIQKRNHHLPPRGDCQKFLMKLTTQSSF